MSDRKKKFKLIDGKAGEGNDQIDQPVALVTGAGRGIGRALLQELLSRGYLVVAVVRSIKDVRELFTLDPKNILPIRCDITEPSTEATLREFLDGQIEKIDLLVNNAGHGASGFGIEGLDIDELSRLFSVHCFGPIRIVKACLPFLRNAPHAVVANISSRFGSVEWVSSGTVPNDQSTYSYRIAKASLNMFTCCLADELSADDIKVISVDPGKVKTRFGPIDADTEPEDSAKAILNLIDNNTETGIFLHAKGDRLPW